MLISGTAIPNAAFEERFVANATAILANTDPLYAQLAEQTVRAVSQIPSEIRQLSTGLMPVAYFGMRSAAEVVMHPDVAPMLPSDVERRAGILRACSDLMIGFGAQRGIFTNFYQNDDRLRPLLSVNEDRLEEALSGEDDADLALLTMLGEVAIMDEGIVAGGALRLLRRHHRDALKEETAAAIVGRSVGLQMIALVPDDNLDIMRMHLGAPYTDTKNLRFIHGAVDFTPEARQFLRSLMLPGKGCPAHSALTGKASSTPTFLRLAWAELAEAMLPPNAKAELPPKARPGTKNHRKR